MQVPDCVKGDFEIIEREIHGQVHYGVIQTRVFLGIKFKVQRKIWGIMHPEFAPLCHGQRWVIYKSDCQSAIRAYNSKLVEDWVWKQRR